jgi:Flp pilus assembly protein TadG
MRGWLATRNLLPLAARWRRDDRAAAAVEFALVSVVFTLGLMGAFAVAFVLFLRFELDYATSKAARLIMNGTVQKTGYSADSFRTELLCTNLSVGIDCDKVIVNVKTATKSINPGGYYAFVTSDVSGLVIPALDGGSSSFDPGVQGSYIYVQVIYPITFLPNLILDFLSNGQVYKGDPAYLAISTAAFRNEQY